ncbi:hypothetical protein LGR54_18125 [Ancylobacter sp. Lp-2]|uniref:hypothetical protein n=1 Tax=Ancylobacter sp. Lp-2 TaxID=2881339 RepID=UPI001E2A0A84|nr:hypothetical protein [Ancylobacter sp. Lp-2]MCB4770529.1 hypothetical protein [Ancylobacter sp. Lp-2]
MSNAPAPSSIAAFASWDKDDQGRLKMWPLQAFTTALMNNETVGLRLEIGTSQPKPGEPVPALQLVLRPEQVRELANALAEAEARLADAHFSTVGSA